MADTAGLYDQSVVRQVDALIEHGLATRASDIHLEPTDRCLRVRFRVDGVLYDKPVIEKSIMHQLISRLKVMSHINIAEKRIPQDGKFVLQYNGTSVDFRVSTFPCLFGEKVVIRILDRTAHKMSVDQLGFEQAMYEKIHGLIHKQQGFFLVTGPTGSGKTTTLYALLSAVHNAEKNIVTLEDPVEYHIEGVTQGHINPDAGFTFARGIRALLRQDPDVLLVGEIRDRETARTAIEAALTGHLVLSTLHTNDAPGAVMRLMDMGIEPFLLNASLSGILAQRLVRKLCQQCKEPIVLDRSYDHLCIRLGITSDVVLYEGHGCSECNGYGYRGRIGVFELLLVTPALRARIVDRPLFDEVYVQALQDGMITLLQDGIVKVKSGLISLQELARVVA